MNEIDPIFIIKITSDCNLSCSYCYHCKNPISMDLKDIDEIYSKISSDFTSVSISWHGGEPLLLGIEYFKELIKKQKSYDCHFSNWIQTNGILLNQQFAEFFKSNNFIVGLSYDILFHDKFRGRRDLVLKSIELLKNNGNSFGIISVIPEFDPLSAKAWYKEFTDIGCDVQFNVISDYNNSKESIDNQYIDGLIELFDLWYYDSLCNQSIKPFIDVILMFFQSGKRPCYLGQCLFNFITIKSDLSLSFCDKMDFEGPSLANIDSFEDFFESSYYENIVSKVISNNRRCKEYCSIYRYCLGGCVYESIFDVPTKYRCQLRREVITHIFSTIIHDPGLSHCNRYIRNKVLSEIPIMKSSSKKIVWRVGDRVYKCSADSKNEFILYTRLFQITSVGYEDLTSCLEMPFISGTNPDISADFLLISHAIKTIPQVDDCTINHILKYNKNKYLSFLDEKVPAQIKQAFDYDSLTDYFVGDEKQIVHGDFTRNNLIVSGNIIHIIDIENMLRCSPEFDLTRLLIHGWAQSISMGVFPHFLDNSTVIEHISDYNCKKLNIYLKINLLFQLFASNIFDSDVAEKIALYFIKITDKRISCIEVLQKLSNFIVSSKDTGSF